MFVRITVPYPGPGHYFNYSNSDTSYVHVYNVISKGAKNKIVAQKKMIVSFLFVLKF